MIFIEYFLAGLIFTFIFRSGVALNEGDVDVSKLLLHSQTSECKPTLDVIFLLDSSNSVKDTFKDQVQWANALVSLFPVSREGVHVGAIQYSGLPMVEFALNTYTSSLDIQEHFRGMEHRSGVTRTGAALKKAKQELYNPLRGGRFFAKKLIILMTDGISLDDPLPLAEQMRNDDKIIIDAVALAKDAYMPELMAIAGNDSNCFRSSDLLPMKAHLFEIMKNILNDCQQHGTPVATFNGSATTSGHQSSTTHGRTVALSTTAVTTTKNSTEFPYITTITTTSTTTSASTTRLPPSTTATTGQPTTTNTSTTTTIPRSTSVLTTAIPVTTVATTTTTASTSSKIKNAVETSYLQPTTKSVLQSTSSNPTPTGSDYVKKTTPATTTATASATSKKARKCFLSQLDSSAENFEESLDKNDCLDPEPTAKSVDEKIPVKNLTLIDSSKIDIHVLPAVKIIFDPICPLNVLFVLDSSSSVQEEFDKQKQIIKGVVDLLTLDPKYHKVALMQFSGYLTQQPVFAFDAYQSNYFINNEIDNLRQLYGTSYVGAALIFARNMLYRRREDAKTIVIVITDGYSQDDAIQPAEILRSLYNAEIYTLTKSKEYDRNYLKRISGKPLNVYIGEYEIERFKDMFKSKIVHCNNNDNKQS